MVTNSTFSVDASLKTTNGLFQVIVTVNYATFKAARARGFVELGERLAQLFGSPAAALAHATAQPTDGPAGGPSLVLCLTHIPRIDEHTEQPIPATQIKVWPQRLDIFI